MINTDLGDLIGRARRARRSIQNLQGWLCALDAKVSTARTLLATPAPEDAARAYLRELVEWYDTFKAVVDASPLLSLDIEAFVHGKRTAGVGTADDRTYDLITRSGSRLRGVADPRDATRAPAMITASGDNLAASRFTGHSDTEQEGGDARVE
jgi:hypothetical protein